MTMLYCDKFYILGGVERRDAPVCCGDKLNDVSGLLSQPCSSPRTCSEPGSKYNTPSCYKGLEKPSHDASGFQWY
jgi:hypothetical protein